MKKRIFSLLAGLIVAASGVNVLPAVTADAAKKGEYEYELNDDGTAYITDYFGSAEDLKLPSAIDGKKVTGIGVGAFSSLKNLVSVSIPDTVEYIDSDAFAFCPNLKNVEFFESLKYVSDEVFMDCTSLENIDLPESVIYLGMDVFAGTALLANQTTDVKYADTWAIGYEKSAKNLAIKFGTVGIANQAFSPEWNDVKGKYTINNIETVTMPDTLKYIGELSFQECSNLKSVSMPDSIVSIGVDAFIDTAVVTNQKTDVKYVGKWAVECAENAKSASIKNGTLGIAEMVFSGTNIKSASIPCSVKTIPYAAFNACYSLSSVTIASGVKEIDDWSFNGCESIKSIKIPGTVERIGTGAFFGCLNLSSLTLNQGIKVIDDGAFCSCEKLKTVTAPKSVYQIGEQALGYTVDYSSDELDIVKLKGFTLKCYLNSAAEKYAKSSKLSYDFVDVAKPATVSGFKVSSTSASAVKLTWNKVSGAQGYIIYKYDNSKKTWVRVAKTTTTANSYTVSKLSACTTYKFAVKAYKTVNGKEILSTSFPQVSTSTAPATVNFKLTAGSRKATVKWNKVKGATGYIVYYKTSAKGKWQRLAVSKGTSYTKTGLTRGKTYYFTVKAYRTVNGKTYNGAYTTKSVKAK